jgi:hypothetical protein
VARLHARTIVEAHLYLDLLRADGALGDTDPGDPGGWTTLTEGGDAWTLLADGGGAFDPFEIGITFADVAEARRTGLRFGARPSTLIDAGQWQELGTACSEQAIAAELAAAGAPDDATLLAQALHAWDFAIDVTGEALRFLPTGVAEMPLSAFWSERGRQAHQEDPDRFTRRALARQVAVYRTMRDDFAELAQLAEPARSDLSRR